MTTIALTPTDSGRGAAPSCNLTDNKTACVAGNTYTFPNDGRVVALCNSAAGCNLVAAKPGTDDGAARPANTTAVAAGKVAPVGPFPAALYTDVSTGLTSFSVSANCDVLLVRVP